MGTFLLYAAAAAAVAGLFLLLYRQGLLVLNTKTALLYVGTPRLGKNRLGATVSACSGSVRRVIRLKKAARYRFVLSPEMTEGTVCVEIRGRGTKPAARLSAEAPCAVIDTGATARYRITTEFERAGGTYTLCWDEL